VLNATKLIPLTQGHFAIVDDEDYEWLSKWKWCYGRQYNTNYGYAKRAYRRDGKLISVTMHRLIANTPNGCDTDHINGNTLDNRKVNIRVCNRSLNQHNRGKQKNNISGFKGVSFHKKVHKFQTQIQHNGIKYHLGYFSDPREAHDVYLEFQDRMTGGLCFP
jgi:hypothetical protein